MVRSTLAQQVNRVLTFARKRAVTVLALSAFLAPLPAFAVTQAQLNQAEAQIQTLNQNIRASDARISLLEREIRGHEQQILATRKQLREERLAGRKQVFDLRRELKLQEFEIGRIEKDVALLNANLDALNRDISRDNERFAALNVVKQGLESGDYKNRQAEYARQRAILDEKKAALLAQQDKARNQQATLQQQLAALENEADDSALDRDPRLGALLQKRDQASTELVNLRTKSRNDRARVILQQEQLAQLSAQFKREQQTRQTRTASAAVAKPVAAPVPAATPVPAQPLVRLDRTDYNSWVFVISGDQEPDIEQTLHLKNWVESYGAKYIQARWNGFEGVNGVRNTAAFKETFRSYIRQIPKDARIVLIGHGLGGGAAIEAATGVAYSESRAIDFLAALDPIGNNNLRANIVYSTDGACTRPDKGDDLANTDYVACIKTAHKRLITANIKYFYNRWQKDAQGPLDFQRQISSLDSNGKVVQVPTATGRFEVAENTGADQKRLFFAGDRNAHHLLLAEEAKQLPKLLVQYLR